MLHKTIRKALSKTIKRATKAQKRKLVQRRLDGHHDVHLYPNVLYPDGKTMTMRPSRGMSGKKYLVRHGTFYRLPA